MKTMTQTLFTRLALMAAAVLLTTLPAQAQSSEWQIDDQVEGYQANHIRALPDGTLVTAGHPLVRWRNPEGNPQDPWETIDQIPTNADIGSFHTLAVDLNGTVYAGGTYFVRVPNGRGHQTTVVVYAVLRKGWRDGTDWVWEDAYLEPYGSGVWDVEVDATGTVYILVEELDGSRVVKRSVSGGDLNDWEVISDNYDFNQDPDSGSLFPQYDVADDIRSMAVDAAGNVYVAGQHQKVVDTVQVIQGKGHKQYTTTNPVTEEWVLIRRFDADTGLWSTIQKTPAVGPYALFVTSDGVVLYNEGYYGPTGTSLSGTPVEVTWAGTYGQDWSWHLLNVPSGTGGTMGVTEGPDGTVYFARTGTDAAGNTANYILSSLDLVNWTEVDVPSYIGLLDVAIQNGSMFVSGLGLDSNYADVLRKDLP